jgi:Na+-transporting methylmalonyl-CoA/oxaloacetate decarboxylase gamma subunit
MYPNFEEALLALVIGMGGVMAFLAVLTLVTAMITRVWKEPSAAAPSVAAAPERPLTVAPPPAAAVSPKPQVPAEAADEGALAAAVAVGLHLRGGGSQPGAEVAAAVGTALALHRARTAAGAEALREAGGARGTPWRLAGSLEAMGGRMQRRERSGYRGAGSR